ncbi:helix-turn-helix domain-containing protein [Micrococcus luteus]|uniref:helix-turn-helix domain-containing protein n=1 Tax=Micrococcus luteus TaxID=1270 RepID=UPI0030193837
MSTLEQLTAQRPPRREIVDAHKEQMRAQARAYRLRELRESLHLTQSELAAELQVSQNRVSTIERGDLAKAQLDTLRRYVQALGGTLNLEVQLGDETFKIA